MILGIKKIAQVAGIDKAVAYTVLSRLIQAGGGVVSIFFIAKYLSIVEQGYYYTFGSILAIQIFFELGLSGIVTQFVAHERAHLHVDEKDNITGDLVALSRLSSLLRFCVRWYLVIAIFLSIVLILAGSVFFSRYGTDNVQVSWRIPWTIISISTSCALMISPIFAFFEGLGNVKEVAKVRLIQQLCQLVILLLLLFLGFKLFASPVASIISLLIPLFFFIYPKIGLLQKIWNSISTQIVNYGKEIFPFQWRIAVSWISGYFIFQLFNPVLFATEGAIVAAQMGITLSVLNGVTSLSLSWVNTKIPLMAQLIAKKEFKSLDSVFNRMVKQLCFISLLALVAVSSIIYLLQYNRHEIGFRFLSGIPLILLCIATFCNQLNYALASYLRCFKKEPFLILSIVVGVSTAASTFVLGNIYGLLGITGGYCLIVIASVVWAILIFKKKRALWSY